MSKLSQREARWRAIIKRQRSGGAGVAGFCRREGLALSTFHWWRRRLESPARAKVQWMEAQAPALLAVGPAGPGLTGPGFAGPGVDGAGPAVRVGTASGLWIEFAAPPGTELLSAALHALRATEGGASC